MFLHSSEIFMISLLSEIPIHARGHDKFHNNDFCVSASLLITSAETFSNEIYIKAGRSPWRKTIEDGGSPEGHRWRGDGHKVMQVQGSCQFKICQIRFSRWTLWNAFHCEIVRNILHSICPSLYKPWLSTKFTTRYITLLLINTGIIINNYECLYSLIKCINIDLWCYGNKTNIQTNKQTWSVNFYSNMNNT